MEEWRAAGRGDTQRRELPVALCDVPALPFWRLLDAFPNNSHFHGNDELPEKQRIPPLIFLHPVQSATALNEASDGLRDESKSFTLLCNLSRIPAQSWAFFKEADKSHKAGFHLNSGSVQQWLEIMIFYRRSQSVTHATGVT